jgi:hypothetical protein
MVIAALPLFIVPSHRAHHAKSCMLRMRGDVVVVAHSQTVPLGCHHRKGQATNVVLDYFGRIFRDASSAWSGEIYDISAKRAVQLILRNGAFSAWSI